MQVDVEQRIARNEPPAQQIWVVSTADDEVRIAAVDRFNYSAHASAVSVCLAVPVGAENHKFIVYVLVAVI